MASVSPEIGKLESDSKLRALVEASAAVMLALQDGRIIYTNPAASAISGYSTEELLGRSVLDFVTPEFRELILSRPCSENGETTPQHREIKYLTKDKQERWLAYTFSSLMLDNTPTTVVNGIDITERLKAVEVEIGNDHSAPLINYQSEVIAQLALGRDVTERKRSEQILRESKESYRELFENAKDAHYVHDLEGRYLSVNRAAEKLIGYPREQIIGKPFTDFFPPDQLERVIESIQRKLIERGETIYETEVIASDGRRVPVEISSHLIYENDVAVGVQGAARDITERKRAEGALRESEREYRGLFENAHDAILLIHPEKEIVLEVNQRACEMYGISREDFIGTSLETLSKDVSRGRSRINETLQKGVSYNFETTQWRGDGTEMSLQVNASVVEYKGQQVIQSINRDITEQRRAEEALRQSEERFSKAFHSSPAALFNTLLNDGRLLEVNSAFLRMTGYSRDEVLGRTTVDLGLWDHDDRLAMARALSDHGAIDNFKIKFRKKSGEVRDGLLSAELIELDDGERSVLGSAQDVTERYRAEEALKNYPRQLIAAQEAERQNIARELHDQIGQVLTAINLNLSALWQTCRTAKAKMLVSDGLAIVDEALGQVRDLSFELRPSLLDDLGLLVALRWYADRFVQRTGIRVVTSMDLPESPGRFKREVETACFRIVQESLTNVVRHARAKNVSIVLNSEDNALHLTVTDDGIGFEVRSPSLAQFTTRVGLRGMRERALALGGRLDITSWQGRGTEIRAVLPQG